MITGEQLRLLRLLKGLSQDNVATSMNISQPRYSAIEKLKTIDGDLLRRALKALECTIEEVKGIKRISPDE